MTQIKKQNYDESTKDTPEYDLRKSNKKVAKLEKELAKLKAEYAKKFGQAV